MMLTVSKIKDFLLDYYFSSQISNPIKPIISYFANKEEYKELIWNGRNRSLGNGLYYSVINKIFCYGKIYENLKIYKILNFKDKNVIDIGSWIGDTTILFKKWGANKVFAFEPLKENIERIRKIVKFYGYENDIIVFPYAIYKKRGKIKFKIKEEKVGKGNFSLEEKGGKEITFKCITWKDLLKFAIKNKVDIIKVDCEGCEKYLVNVDKNLLEKIRY